MPFYGFLLFYLVFCFIAAATSENKENKEQIDGLLLSGALIAAGTILEAIDWQTLFLPFFITLGVSCIYITVRNPDLFKDKKTGLLSSAAFNLLMKEPLKHHQACGFGFAIRSYNQCRVSYGSAVVDRYLSHFGEYIRNEFLKKYCFYLHNGHFLIVSPGFMDIHAPIAKIHQQFKDPWIREGESASFDIGCCYIDNRLNYSSPAELRESLELAFNDIDTLEHKDIVVDEKYKQRAERQPTSAKSSAKPSKPTPSKSSFSRSWMPRQKNSPVQKPSRAFVTTTALSYRRVILSSSPTPSASSTPSTIRSLIRPASSSAQAALPAAT